MRASQAALERTIDAHAGAIFALACAPDAQWIVSGASDKLVKKWSAVDGTVRTDCPHGARSVHRERARMRSWRGRPKDTQSSSPGWPSPQTGS
jgi:hypothetical protein